jgi:hypothetical protein
MKMRKIVILTPVKDEAWILSRFLLAVCEVADHVLVLDQKSDDASRSICEKYPKVTVIENLSGDYSEAARSRLLLDGARARFGDGNVLIALDADEILAGNSLRVESWKIFRTLPLGTVIYFEKPEMLPHPERCIRQTCWFPLGLVDDGAQHEGKTIHSHRLPVKPGALSYYAADICAMHFARLRPVEYAIRQAFYCMVENIKRTKSHRVRNTCYSPRVFMEIGSNSAEPCPKEWFDWFIAKGVDVWSYETMRFNTFHVRSLRLFAEHGTALFYWDDIWWEDWEAARLHFIKLGVSGLPLKPIKSSPRAFVLINSQIIRVYLAIGYITKMLKNISGLNVQKAINTR